jgi:hypothetical protein
LRGGAMFESKPRLAGNYASEFSARFEKLTLVHSVVFSICKSYKERVFPRSGSAVHTPKLRGRRLKSAAAPKWHN